ncbi:hypothetical protein [Achromobacter sp. NFACC18-2]|uniref:hypothetical protein n=1 Tax=Achromobacter sp. NFACC18-2 TaxID=1564112 RepID=UPI0008C50613|nr:hypothetical protein [Achromobacter sp. NFACC18-2]SEK12142.1 hypothetical protein SAMN03159494_05598 [Achromobacter sp. NFACC18-2]
MTLEEFESVAKIASPIVALILGPMIKRLMTAKPKVIRYVVHVSTHRQRLDDGQLVQLHTHAVIYENVGRSAAHNLRISHGVLPVNVVIFPPVQFKREPAQDGPGGDIAVPVLAPKERITISYMYPSTLMADSVHGPAKTDEALVKDVQAQLIAKPPKILYAVLAGLCLLGVSVLVYLLLVAAYRFVAT